MENEDRKVKYQGVEMTHRRMMKIISLKNMAKCKNKCGMDKRNGSAYCQMCSDKYKLTNVTK